VRIYYSTDFASNRKASEELLLDALKCEGLLVTREDIARSESGKPYLKCANLNFSISHSENIWMCACSDVKLGIDFQFYKELDFDRLATRFFTQDEYEFLVSETPARKEELFFEIWAKKEAAAKLFETGIFKYGLSKIETVNMKNGKYVEAEEIVLSVRGLWINQSELRFVKERLKNTVLHDKFALSICLAEKRTVEGIIEIGNR